LKNSKTVKISLISLKNSKTVKKSLTNNKNIKRKNRENKFNGLIFVKKKINGLI